MNGISMGAYGARPYAFAFVVAPHGAMGKPHSADRAGIAPNALWERQIVLERRVEARETTESFAGDDARHDDDDELDGHVLVLGVFFSRGALVKRRPRRLLNPAFREAVYDSTLRRHAMAQLVGYGIHVSNLYTDLRRPEGPAPTPLVRERMAKLARLVGFPEERVWL